MLPQSHAVTSNVGATNGRKLVEAYLPNLLFTARRPALPVS